MFILENNEAFFNPFKNWNNGELHPFNINITVFFHLLHMNFGHFPMVLK
jgi:hypothetical protein